MWYWLEAQQWVAEEEKWNKLHKLQQENPEKHNYYQKLMDDISERVMREMDRKDRDQWVNHVGEI